MQDPNWRRTSVFIEKDKLAQAQTICLVLSRTTHPGMTLSSWLRGQIDQFINENRSLIS